jgi:hypothetical protein
MWIEKNLITDTKIRPEQSTDKCYSAENMIPGVNTHPMTIIKPET